MRRYIEIYRIMLRNSLIREMSFKANFLLWMVVEVLWFLGQIVFFSIIFGSVNHIGDWSKWEVVLLVGTHQIIAQLFQAFFFVNVANVPELVRTGKLDSLLVLPIDSQFAVSTKQFGLDSVVNAVLGGVVVVVSLTRLGVTPHPIHILLYLIAIGFGIAIHYSIMGFLADKIVFAGVGKTVPEMVLALEGGIHSLHVESTGEMEMLADVAEGMGKVAPVAVRVNPDVDAGTHKHITTGTRANKFGVAPEVALELVRRAAQSSHLEPVGLHVILDGVDSLTPTSPRQASMRF